MTTTARAPPPVSRRASLAGTNTATTSSPSIARGATARSAVSSRASSINAPVAARRASIVKGKASPPLATNPEARDSRESLSASLKQEMEKKEQLLVQLQDKEQAIAALNKENGQLTSALNSAESRLAELYADQGRMEEEMAARIEVIEKLRTQVRDLEKEKRDVQRRYNEQTRTFEAERQAFYDNEQHLKSRIQSLTQARRQPAQPLTSPSVASISESETEVEDEPPEPPVPAPKQDVNDPEQEPAEMTALRLELSTLSTSYASLQSTLSLLQSQLVDLKRVNNELQEENESYNILLREKTLNGQFDVMRMGGGEASASETGEDDDMGEESSGDSLRSRSRSVLDPVDEEHEPELEEEERDQQHELDPAFEQAEAETEPRDVDEPPRSARRHGRKHSSSAPRGESLANLPITGPGLDLAAELGRAENKDILEGRATIDNDRVGSSNVKAKKGRKNSTSDTGRKTSSVPEAGGDAIPTDLDALRSEVKSLKDANKALSLYASKIIDRIISQEGFEHVLAADYEKTNTPNTPGSFTTFSNLPKSPNPAPPPKKTRPQSVFSFSSSSASTNAVKSPQPERLTTFNSPPTPSSANSLGPPAPAKISRRSLSFDWRGFTMFGGSSEKKTEPTPSLRPLTLKVDSNTAVPAARKLETYEDEEDRRERERLNATMKLMGIEKPPAAMQKSYSTPTNPTGLGAMDVNGRQSPLAGSITPGGGVSPVVPPTPSRFSFFRRNSSMTSSDTSSKSGSPQPAAATPNLTQEALEQAEAENTIAALDAHERQLSAEIAKGGGGGFTEIARRADRRSSRKSGSESASTVWSAGMGHGDD
ncbi:hypothetical protein WOLCODRAFT_94269 [Wolfiporia cocos MD-104 SS10]|uniref:Uncharacterized protein n=1 Tax=Wolfiporia cocos (strain MD-104) TaxID=742152 RepID=A0A2H3IWL8_WOLCO|nr:hypothetical protein WOLCODRAFT_94269 [Wolfiporia cocos MD-104 SS10]